MGWEAMRAADADGELLGLIQNLGPKRVLELVRVGSHAEYERELAPLRQASAAPTCGTCRFYHEILREGGTGICRRFPPTPTSDFPGVDTRTWCGEHQPRS